MTLLDFNDNKRRNMPRFIPLHLWQTVKIVGLGIQKPWFSWACFKAPQGFGLGLEGDLEKGG
jgi:hypothetical protein